MILAKSPFRISFAGGGSDLPDFYRRHTGVVVSTTIDKAMYIAIHPYFHEKIRIKYSRTEDVSNTSEIQHPLVRECLQMMNIDCGMEIASFADVPAGTGMGSSSAFTVCCCMLCMLSQDKIRVPVNWPRLLVKLRLTASASLSVSRTNMRLHSED